MGLELAIEQRSPPSIEKSRLIFLYLNGSEISRENIGKLIIAEDSHLWQHASPVGPNFVYSTLRLDRIDR